MIIETDRRLKISEVFKQENLPMLSPEEIVKSTILVSHNRLDRLKSRQVLELDRGSNIHIVVTGSPRWGKSTAATTVASELSLYEVPFKIETEISENRRPWDLRWDEDMAMKYNFAYALSGLSRMGKNVGFEGQQINIYERGFIDHLVFAEALNKWYEDIPKYREVIEGFKNFFGFYLGDVDGIILCNSSAETSIRNGSTLPRELLNLLAEGYDNFPASLSQITRGEQANPRLIIQLRFEELELPVKSLKKSIYTLIKWKLDGKIEVNPTSSN